MLLSWSFNSDDSFWRAEEMMKQLNANASASSNTPPHFRTSGLPEETALATDPRFGYALPNDVGLGLSSRGFARFDPLAAPHECVVLFPRPVFDELRGAVLSIFELLSSDHSQLVIQNARKPRSTSKRNATTLPMLDKRPRSGNIALMSQVNGSLVIAGRAFRSRLILGTGKFSSPKPCATGWRPAVRKW